MSDEKRDDESSVTPSSATTNTTIKPDTAPLTLTYTNYTPAHEKSYLPAIRALISKDLSEPYSLYVYRYFLYQWGDLCFMALGPGTTSTTASASDVAATKAGTGVGGNEQIVTDAPLIGVIICKLEPHRGGPLRGYIAMLAVQEEYRGKGIATKLVRMAVDRMKERDADEIALETEVTNVPSLKLYERLGFLRSKKLHRYYLNGNAAFRLVLPFREQLQGSEGDEDQKGTAGQAADIGLREMSQRAKNIAGTS